MDPYETFVQNLDIENNPVIPGLSRGGGRAGGGSGGGRTNRGNNYFSLSDNPPVNASNYYNTSAAMNNDNFPQYFNSASQNNIRPTRIAKSNNYFDNNSAAGFSSPTNFAGPSGFNPNANNTFMGGGGGRGGATRGRKRQRFPGKSNNNGRTNENLITGV